MYKKVKTQLLYLSLLTIFCACAKKAEDYSSLVDSYKKIYCKTLSSNKIPLVARERAMQKKIKLEKDFNEALRHLKQEEKEQLTKEWSKVKADAENGNCK
jgi:DNA polymerase III delta subunit